VQGFFTGHTGAAKINSLKILDNATTLLWIYKSDTDSSVSLTFPTPLVVTTSLIATWASAAGGTDILDITAVGWEQ